MKNTGKFLITLFAFAFCISSYAKDSIEDAYDLYAPSGKTTKCWLHVSGETKGGGRVSFEKGKNPLVVRDENGNLMEKDPNYETRYVMLDFWGGEDSRAFNLHRMVEAPEGKWVKYILTFKPRKAGKIRIEFGPYVGHQHYPDKTMYKYRDLAYARYAKLEAINAKLKDPEFKNPKAWGMQKYYYFKEIKSAVVTDEEAPGGKCLRATGRISQEFAVKAGVPVTITFFYRSDDYFNAKK